MAGRGAHTMTGLAMAAVLLTGSAAVTAASAAPARASAPAPAAASARAAAPGFKPVSYHGYRVRVPAGWPVYNLAADPARCVRFNTHAVYLGTPGANQDCPARAYGRTEALLIQPSGTAAAQQAGVPARADAVSHELRASGPGVRVTATYGRDPSQIRSILAGATTAASPDTTGSAAASASSGAPTASTRPAASAPTPAGAAAATPAAPAPATPASAPGLRGTTGSGLGFDACTAPSEATMKDWLASPYRVAGTYLGGVNWACGYGNFTPSWVRDVSAEGWKFIPIWVGEQAPCSTISGVARIDPSQAAAEGTAEAASAVAAAQGFSYGAGSTLYFDMEGYSTSDAACGQAVLTFLSAWTSGLHAAGYSSGVYSSAGSGIRQLAAQYGATSYDGAPYTSPDAVWIADWDGNPELTGDPYVPDSDWPAGSRLRQYAGGHDETWGGDTVNIDSDAIGGPVAALPGAHVDAGPSLLQGPDAVSVAPGGSATAALTVQGTPAAPADDTWQASPPAGVTVSPASGRVTAAPGTSSGISFTITPDSGLAPGRYEIPVTIATRGKTIAETFEMVSVTPAGTSLPTAHPVVLYAADPASRAEAQAVANADALASGDVTGSFDQAWTDLAGGKDLVIAVGDAAVDGLYYNACHWASPSGSTAGGTPFYYLGAPYRQSPGADIYEPANGPDSALLAAQLAHYALTGSLPDYGRPPAQVPRPTSTCLGTAG